MHFLDYYTIIFQCSNIWKKTEKCSGLSYQYTLHEFSQTIPIPSYAMIIVVGSLNSLVLNPRTML